MAGLLEALLAEETGAVDQVQAATGNDRKRAEQAYGAAVGTLLRGLEQKTQSAEGAQSLWDMLRKEVEKGNLPAEAPAESETESETPAKKPGVQVRDMDPKVANKIFREIFGPNAPQVEGGFGKVITLDPETSRKVFEKVMPAVLGSIFGAAEEDPEESPKALPKIINNARKEMEQRQPKSSSIFEAILDQNHDGKIDLNDLAGIFTPKKPR